MRKESERKREAGHDRHDAHSHDNHEHAHRHDDHHDDHHEGLEPKLSREELKKHRTPIFAGTDGREYQPELPGSWSNAKVAAMATAKVCQECRDSPHFDTDGYSTNRELGRRIQKAFTELKSGKGFVMAWRIYADKDHPRWQIADGCGCCCGGACDDDDCNPKPAAKAAKRKPAKKAKKSARR
jgi:hypothetical protein